jgi:redox-sensitive bicupin YhaK (pirin superfamily)
MSLRPVKQIIQPKETMEGAGVKLQRAFGFGKTKEFDPFLLLDDFRNDDPEDYRAGFPWHPHRGIRTVASKPLRMCLPVRLNTETAWATKEK